MRIGEAVSHLNDGEAAGDSLPARAAVVRAPANHDRGHGNAAGTGRPDSPSSEGADGSPPVRPANGVQSGAAARAGAREAHLAPIARRAPVGRRRDGANLDEQREEIGDRPALDAAALSEAEDRHACDVEGAPGGSNAHELALVRAGEAEAPCKQVTFDDEVVSGHVAVGKRREDGSVEAPHCRLAGERGRCPRRREAGLPTGRG
jgi:hypothetical protein